MKEKKATMLALAAATFMLAFCLAELVGVDEADAEGSDNFIVTGGGKRLPMTPSRRLSRQRRV